jgi:hypothetical protein
MYKTFGVLTVFAVLVLLSAEPALAADRNFTTELESYQEVPSISSLAAAGEFEARLSSDETTLTYTLSYAGLEGTVTQSHIHFGQHSVNGAVVVFLCQTATNPDPTGLAPMCPQEGTVEGRLTAANMTGTSTAQGIATGEFAELVAALRGGVTYVNVHSSKFPGGEIRGQLK